EDTTANALDITSAIAVNAGQWNHFAAVLDRNLDELRLYLNGALAASSALPAGFAGIEGGTDNVAIGALRNGTTGVLDTFYTGALDEIRLWGVARTQQEIQDDMNLEVTSAPGLIARWGLNEGSPSSTTADSVGMNDGTLNGATWIAGGLAPLGQCSITAVPGCIPCSSDPECTDSNPCTLNSCDLATNRCLTLFEPMGAACADGDLCNGDEQCDGAGACFAGDPPDCDDGVLCTVDGCDATLGCVQTPDDLLCDDGDPCTDDACDVGGSQCVHTPVPDCVACGGDFLPLQDFNTVPGDEPADWFDSGAGNVLTLDDNFDVQNVGGELALGTTSALVNIHSHYITAESANWADYTLSTRGLVTSSNAGWGVTVLSDFPNSDTYYRLRMGSFRRTLHLSPHGTFPDCGGNDVGDTGFEPVVGEWFRVKVQVEDDGANTFIRAKAWPDDGTAEPANWQTECIDSDPSTRRTRGTVGLWSMSSGGHYWDDVQVVSNTGAGSSCDDGDACNGLETCQAGFCANGTPPICDDGDPCNGVETCDPASGCQGGMALDCDDGNPCTTDSCNPAGGCINDPLAAGSPCGDGNACNGDETCDDFAVCQDGVAPICDDGTVCNGLESCDPIDGCQSGVPLVCTDANVCNGLETCDPIDGCQPGTLLVCDDGNDCNGLETCDAMNGCELGSPIDCDDGDPCTADSCVVATGACLNDPIPACEPDARVVPIVSLVDPATTPETTVPIAGAPPSEAFVPAGQDFWVEVWATDSGVLNTGLVAVYVDVVSCGDPVAMDVGHGSVFNVLSSGTIGAGLVDDFGGSAVADGDPSNDGIEPDWVRIGWIRHQADASLLNCEIRVQASGLEPQLSALGRGLVPWSDVQLGSTIVSAGQSVPSVDYDLDGDGVIGPGDLALFYVSFGMTVPPGDVAHDFDCDGTVGPVDLAWFQSGWMKPVGDPTLQYSPECP
ncbi:MAG: hypothetical protein OEV00_11585, partial [Acidobacteriota bacterium]|nr:hypothetical protein [Acidobacteriota bacterium]